MSANDLLFRAVPKVKHYITRAKVYNGTIEGKGKGATKEDELGTGESGGAEGETTAI